MEFVVDRGRAVEVFGKILDAYRNNAYPFNLRKARVPYVQCNMPKNLEVGSLEYITYFQNINYWMAGGVNSDSACQGVTLTCEENLELFNPFNYRDIDPHKLAERLTYNGLGYGKKTKPFYWVENYRRIVERWDGNLLNVFHDILDYPVEKRFDILCSRLRNDGKGGGLLGTQKKMTSMITHSFQDNGLIDDYPQPTPADFHWFRKSIAHEFLRAKNGKPIIGPFIDEIGDAIRELTLWYVLEFGESSLDLCNAVWIFSRMMCSNHPQNKTLIVGERDGRNTEIAAVPVVWGLSQIETYKRTCGACIVKDTCKNFVRAAYYYIQGQVVSEPRVSWQGTREDSSSLFDPVSYFAVRENEEKGAYLDENWRTIRLAYLEEQHYLRLYGKKEEEDPHTALDLEFSEIGVVTPRERS